MRRIVSLLGVAVLVAVPLLTTVDPASAWQCPGDFMTGGGYIVGPAGTPPFPGLASGAKGNFAIGGGCKEGGDGHGLWGHLEFIDHGSGLNVHWLTITAYRLFGTDSKDPKTHQPIGTRQICGTARSNTYGDVNWVVGATDNGEPGTNDKFGIRLTQPANVPPGTPQHIVYTTESPGSELTTLGGGNIQLHKSNNSTNNLSGSDSCPAWDDVS